MAKKIFITGCAKSGTTLLLRMCYAFKDTDIIYRTGFNGHELSIEEFLHKKSEKKFLIGKRLPPAILSNSVEAQILEDQAEWIRKNDIGIINVIRDGRDVVLSDGNYVKPHRWINSIAQREKFSDIIDVEVKYEDLVKWPNNVQDNIMNVFGIERNHHFSEYPEYVSDWIYDWNVSVTARAGRPESDYGKRKLSSKSIGKDKEAYKHLCNYSELQQFEKHLSNLGYKD